MLSENVSDILEDKDGGYILAGETAKYSAMGRDILIAKLDADGKKQWEKYYGEKYDDSAVRVVPTADGGFAVAGTYGGFTSINKDAVVLKLDAGGDKVWEKVFGGKDSDSAAAVRQTKDLGFIVAGSTSSYGNGTSDVYVVKLRHNGNIEWERTFGGGRGDGATDVIQTQDGGYAVLGYTDSYNKNTTKILLIRLDANGAEVPFDRAKTE